MSTSELQSLKMAWLAAKEADDTQAQIHLLRDYPTQQAELITFIAAYHATNGQDEEQPLALTQRAMQTALERVFVAPQVVPATLVELRQQSKLTKAAVAKALRLSIDVWQLFEDGTIELVSLSQRQLDRLAQFFQVSGEQFGTMLSNSQPSLGMNRRQSKAGAQREAKKQSFKQAVVRSNMAKEDKKFWSEQ
ncbi:MAG: hypothetical protein NVS4B11_28800 [Ktedonobacteraceae bacterium]